MEFVEKRGFEIKANANLRCTSNRGRAASTLPAKLNVAREVVNVGRGILVTLYTEGGRGLGVGNDELHLAEHARGRQVSLTHVAELARTRTVDGGGILGALATSSGIASTLTIAGPSGSRENTRCGVQGVDTARVGERRHRHKVTSIRGDLLKEGRDGGHLILYQEWRK